jgi:hypothetical protein
MAKLHEILSVDQQLKAQATATRTELTATFKNKRHLFEEKLVVVKSLAEGQPDKTEAQSDIQSTVREELDWIAGIWSKAIDTSYAVAVGNKTATADVVLDNGTVLLSDVPATALLELTKRAAELLELIKGVPTLDPAKGFTADAARGRGIYQARTVFKTRTMKTQKPIVLFPATPEHPAQTQLITEDVPVATVEEREWSGLLTPVDKGTLIERVEDVQRAVKKALARANDTTITDTTGIAAKLFGYVLAK